jgi:hypothetical protein
MWERVHETGLWPIGTLSKTLEYGFQGKCLIGFLHWNVERLPLRPHEYLFTLYVQTNSV